MRLDSAPADRTHASGFRLFRTGEAGRDVPKSLPRGDRGALCPVERPEGHTPAQRHDRALLGRGDRRLDRPTVQLSAFVVVRIACRVGSGNGAYRLARLAAKFGPEIGLSDLFERFSYDCLWHAEARGKGRQQNIIWAITSAFWALKGRHGQTRAWWRRTGRHWEDLSRPYRAR